MTHFFINKNTTNFPNLGWAWGETQSDKGWFFFLPSNHEIFVSYMKACGGSRRHIAGEYIRTYEGGSDTRMDKYVARCSTILCTNDLTPKWSKIPGRWGDTCTMNRNIDKCVRNTDSANATLRGDKDISKNGHSTGSENDLQSELHYWIFRFHKHSEFLRCRLSKLPGFHTIPSLHHAVKHTYFVIRLTKSSRKRQQNSILVLVNKKYIIL
jgi:hypothetical protein